MRACHVSMQLSCPLCLIVRLISASLLFPRYQARKRCQLLSLGWAKDKISCSLEINLTNIIAASACSTFCHYPLREARNPPTWLLTAYRSTLAMCSLLLRPCSPTQVASRKGRPMNFLKSIRNQYAVAHAPQTVVWSNINTH